MLNCAILFSQTMVKYQRLQCLTHSLCSVLMDIKWYAEPHNCITVEHVLLTMKVFCCFLLPYYFFPMLSPDPFVNLIRKEFPCAMHKINLTNLRCLQIQVGVYERPKNSFQHVEKTIMSSRAIQKVCMWRFSKPKKMEIPLSQVDETYLL